MGASQATPNTKFSGLPMSAHLMQQLAQTSDVTYAAYISGRRFKVGQASPNPSIANAIVIIEKHNNPATSFSSIIRTANNKFISPNIAWYLENTPSNLSALCRLVNAARGQLLSTKWSSNGVVEITVGAIENPGDYEGNTITMSSPSALNFTCPL